MDQKEMQRRMEEMRARMREINREFGGANHEAIAIYEDCTMYDIPQLAELVLLERKVMGAKSKEERLAIIAEFKDKLSKVKKIPNAPERILLWPEGKMPKLTEYTENTDNQYFHDPDFQPYMLEVLVPENVQPVGAVITVAGGQHGPNTLNECYQINREFNALGYQGFILHCRPNACPWDPRETGADVARAVRLIRANAAKYRIDPDRIALAGFSNGGIAGDSCIRFYSGDQTVKDSFPDYEPDELDKIPGCMDVFLCVYGARHKGTEPSNPRVVYPACFFACGLEDKAGVVNLYSLLPELIEHNVRLELHTFAGQPHGYAGWKILEGNGNPTFDYLVQLADVFMQDTYKNYR